MERERGKAERRRRWLGFCAMASVMTLAMACAGGAATVTPETSAESGSPSSSPTPSERPTLPDWIATPTPTPTIDPATGQEPEPAYETESPPPPTPTPFKGPLPSLSPAPDGYWKGINWVQIPTGHAPAVPPVVEGAWDVNVQIKGWSKGYVQFVWDPRKRTVTPWASTDGLTWTAGARLDTSGWAAEFKEYDAQVADYLADDPAARWECSFQVIDFKQGPTNLVLRGQVLCMGGCGGPWYTLEKMWVSTDGLAWTAVDMPNIFGPGGVSRMSAGSRGFVALGYKESGNTLWTSPDAVSWQEGALPPEVLAPGATVGGPVSFAGGFVLPGVLLVAKGTEYSDEYPEWQPGYGYGGFEYHGGCMAPGPDETSRYQGALWWSADGQSWTRINLPSLRTAPQTYVDLTRLDDHTIVAHQSVYTSYSTFDISWVSTDGKTWTQFHGWPIGSSDVLSNLSRGLIYDWAAPQSGAFTFRGFDDKLNMIVLKQSGAMPWIESWKMALGPTGILVTDDGTHYWMGVPLAG